MKPLQTPIGKCLLTRMKCSLYSRLQHPQRSLSTSYKRDRTVSIKHTLPFPSSHTNKQTSRSLSSSSFSKTEVEKFSQLSDTWWDPKENPLIGMNTIRVEYILQNQLSSDDDSTSSLEDKLALDVGCGGGLLSESLCRLGANVTAIDPSVDLVEQAKRHSSLDPKTKNINYRGGMTVEELATSSDQEKFDVICILEVIEHVPPDGLDSMLSSISKLLKPDTGRLFVSTLNRTAKSKALAIVGAEYIMRYLPVGTHDWNQFKSPEEVKASMKNHGLEEVNVSGMVLTSPPFGGKWDWKLDERDTDINWIATYRLGS